ncbi:MAG: metal-dependent hydrolase [Methylotenera sp.]|nr:metal-dependent hydrolase [Oligoflexia bacterium]
MDNITHSLVGIVLAKAVQPSILVDAGRDSIQARRQWLTLFWTAVIASNLPDADLVLTRVGKLSKFDYLLHHRGYTHTLLALIPLALLSALGVSFFFGTWRKGQSPSWFRSKLAAASFAAVLLHLSLDFLNDYGIHAFSPFFNRWFYGDVLFIVDPYIWLALIPFACLQLQNRWARGLWATLGLAMVSVLWLGPFTSVGVATAASLWCIASILLQWKRKSFEATLLAFFSFFMIILLFSVASITAQKTVEAASALLNPQVPVEEISVSPAPGNPLCWRAWIRTQEDDDLAYVTRLGVVSLLPSLLSAENCYPGIEKRGTAQLTPPDLVSTSEISWKGNSHLERQVFDLLRQHSCEFRSFLKFSRLPFLQGLSQGQGRVLVAGDLRYDREAGLGFAEILLSQKDDEACAGDSVPWEAPFFRPRRQK